MTKDMIHQSARRGIALIIIAALLISLQDATFKRFTGELKLWQIFALRGMFAIPLLLLLGLLRGVARTSVSDAYSFWPLMRSVCLTLAFVVFYGVLPFISLSTAGAGIYMAPIFVALLSAFVIGERVRLAGWIGVFLGFAGVLILLRPGSDAFSVLAMLPLISAVFYAIGNIITRTKCQHVAVDALSLSLNSTMCAAGVLISLALLFWPPSPLSAQNYPYILGSWGAVDQAGWLFLMVLAAFAIAIGMTLAGAYQNGPPATIATFEYSYLVFAAIWDIAFFGSNPTGSSVAGMLMIIGAGMLVMRRGN